MGPFLRRNHLGLYLMLMSACALMAVLAGKTAIAEFRLTFLPVIFYGGLLGLVIPPIAYFFDRMMWPRTAALLAVIQAMIILGITTGFTLTRSYSKPELSELAGAVVSAGENSALSGMALVPWWNLLDDDGGVGTAGENLQIVRDLKTGRSFIVGSFTRALHGNNVGEYAWSENGRSAAWLEPRPRWSQLFPLLTRDNYNLPVSWDSEIAFYDTRKSPSQPIRTGLKLTDFNLKRSPAYSNYDSPLDLSPSGKFLLARMDSRYWVFDLIERELIIEGTLPDPLRDDHHQADIWIEFDEKSKEIHLGVYDTGSVKWYTVDLVEKRIEKVSTFEVCESRNQRCETSVKIFSGEIVVSPQDLKKS